MPLLERNDSKLSEHVQDEKWIHKNRDSIQELRIQQANGRHSQKWPGLSPILLDYSSSFDLIKFNFRIQVQPLNEWFIQNQLKSSAEPESEKK